MQVQQLTYRQLQDYIKEAKAQGFTGIKLNASKEALIAEVEAIEASKAKAAKEVETAASVATVAEPEVDLENADVMYFNERNDYTPNKVSEEPELNITTNRVHNEYFVSAPACNLDSKPKGVKWADVRDQVLADPEVKAEYDLLMAVSEPYTETMSAEDEELTAGVELEDEQTDHKSRTYKAVWYTDDDVFCECAITWYCTFNEAQSRLAKLNSEGRKGKRYLACYLPGSELPYGYQYGATWDRPIVTLPEPTYSCTNSHMEPHLESELHTRLTCDICNGQRCDLPEKSLDVNYEIAANYTLWSRPNVVEVVSFDDILKLDLTQSEIDQIKEHGGYLRCRKETYALCCSVQFSHPLEYCATISEWVEGVEGVHRGDHYPGQAVYPDWDESYTCDSYLNSYCNLACSQNEKPVDPLDIEYVEPSDSHEPYIHPELGLVNGGSLTTTVDLSNLADVPADDEPWCVICEADAATCGHSGLESDKDRYEQPCKYCPCGLEAITDCECDFRTAELLDEAYVVTPAVKDALSDTTAHYKSTRREPLIVAAINNTYSFLTSKLVTTTLRSACFWTYASLCVLWAMVQLGWQGLRQVTKLTYEAYRLATSRSVIAQYNTILTTTLLVICTVFDWAGDRWLLLWNFLDSAIALVIGLLPQRKLTYPSIHYFLD